MRYLMLLLVVPFFLCSATSLAAPAGAVLGQIYYDGGSPAELISSAQNFTASWVNLGSETDVRGYSSVGLYINIVANDSVDMRVRAQCLHTSGGTAYLLPILNVDTTSGSQKVNVEDEVFEMTDDVDRSILLSWEIDRVCNYIKFQIEAGTVGATPGQVSTAHIVKRWR